MIARVGHGWTTPEDADLYQDLLASRVLPDIAARGIPGYLGPHVLRRDIGEEVEFVTVLWFESLESVKAFIGEDYEVAHVPDEARAVLRRFDAHCQHYQTILSPGR